MVLRPPIAKSEQSAPQARGESRLFGDEAPGLLKTFEVAPGCY